MVEYFEKVASLGLAKIVHDLLVVFLLVLRFLPFVRNFDDYLSRNIYFALLFSIIYSSSLGFFIDLWIDEFDSEFRIIAALIGALFLWEVAFALWYKFGSGNFLGSHFPLPRNFRPISILWFLVAFCGFLIFEYYLGAPTIYDLHTESFSIQGNLYLGMGRLISRSYIFAAVIISCFILIRLNRTSFSRDPRLRLRGWAAIATIVTVVLHYINVSLGTAIVMINSEWEIPVKNTYEQASSIIIIFVAISVAVLASPRGVLDQIIRLRYSLRSYLLLNGIEWLMGYLLSLLETQPNKTSLRYVPSPAQGTITRRLTHSVVSINDMRRLILRYLDDADVDNLMRKINLYQIRYRHIRKDVLIEALMLNLAGEKIHSGTIVPFDKLSSLIPETQVSSFEDLAMFYSEVAAALKRIGTNSIIHDGKNAEPSEH